MKTKKTNQPAIDPPKEELLNLSSILSEHGSLLSEKQEYQSLFETANSEVEKYSLNGDLRDANAISSMLVRQAQASLVERRLQNIDRRLGEAAEKLWQQAQVVQRLLVGSLYTIRNGIVEKAAKDIQAHFDSLQAARRQAFQTREAKEVDSRIGPIENLGLNLEPPQVAEELLKIGPKILTELAAIRKELGGEIPSEAELRAF